MGVVDIVVLLTASGLFTEAGIKAAAGASSINSIPPSDLAKFVLRKNKVEAAAALGEGMTAAQAGALTTVSDLVQRAVR